MPKIESVRVLMADLKPAVPRSDAIQSFVSQETPIVIITDSDGAQGFGYSYTIGTGGSSVIRLIADHLAPQLIGREPAPLERLWMDLKRSVNATTVGAISSLALAAIDIALWDLRCKHAGVPLHVMAGGARHSAPLYSTEGGWLHVETPELVKDALKVREQGFGGTKIKVGKANVSEDVERLTAVRDAVGPDWEIMTDFNQSQTLPEAIRRAHCFEPFNLAWIEEPMPADDIVAHAKLAAATAIPLAVGESMYSLSQFANYLTQGACTIVQADVARIGGITPWLKVAHMAEAMNVPICPHFLMELHASLVCAVPNGLWVEYIPQLEDVLVDMPTIQGGVITPSDRPGVGLEWDMAAVEKFKVDGADIVLS